MALSERQFEELKKQLEKKRQAVGSEEYSKFITRAMTPPQQAQAPTGMERTAGALDTVFGGGKVGEGIGTGLVKRAVMDGNIGTDFDYSKLSPAAMSRLQQKGVPTNVMDARKEVSDSIQGPSRMQMLGSTLRSASLFAPVGRIAGALGKLGLAPATSAIGAGAVAGYGFDVASDIEQEKSLGDTLKPGMGTAIGAAVPGAIAGTQALANAAPKLLSYTSDVPEEAFNTLLQRREGVTKAIKAGATPESALKNTQGAVRQLRTDLSREWEEGTEQVIQEFAGKRIGLGDNATKLLEKIADDFPVEMPINPKSLSAKEAIDLMKQINALYSKRVVRESAEGITVRKFKDFLEDKMIGSFGGKQGSLAKMYQNYSAKKGVLDAANDIVRAYSTGKPIQQSTALGRLQALFNENKSAYLDAIIDLEKATGRDLLSEITATKFAGKMPNRLSSVSASGGLNAPKGIMDKALDLLILPLSSPRSAAWIARNLSKVKTPNISSPGDALLDSKAGQSLQSSIKDAIENPQGGMSIRPVKLTPEIKAKVAQELEQYDPSPIATKGPGEGTYDLETNFRLLQLQNKNLKGSFTDADAQEAQQLLKKMGIDVTDGNIPQSSSIQKKSNVDGWTGTPSSKPSTVENTSISKKPSERGDVSVRKTDTSGGFDGQVFYRGTNNATDAPFQKGGKLFVTPNEELAKNYGKNISKYYVRGDSKILDASTGEGAQLFNQFLEETGQRFYSARASDGRRLPLWTAEHDFVKWLDAKGVKYDGIWFAEGNGTPSLALNSHDSLLPVKDSTGDKSVFPTTSTYNRRVKEFSNFFSKTKSEPSVRANKGGAGVSREEQQAAKLRVQQKMASNPSPTSGLEAEARKYKSAEEFVKANYKVRNVLIPDSGKMKYRLSDIYDNETLYSKYPILRGTNIRFVSRRSELLKGANGLAVGNDIVIADDLIKKTPDVKALERLEKQLAPYLHKEASGKLSDAEYKEATRISDEMASLVNKPGATVSMSDDALRVIAHELQHIKQGVGGKGVKRDIKEDVLAEFARKNPKIDMSDYYGDPAELEARMAEGKIKTREELERIWKSANRP